MAMIDRQVEDSIILLWVERKIGRELTFAGEGITFHSHNQAEAWLRENGYSTGSMQRGEPISIVKNDNEACDPVDCMDGVTRRYLPKWRYITKDSIPLLDGVMIPISSLREGDTQVLLFNPA